MAGLLDVYENMQKEAEANVEQNALEMERADVITKYASFAEETLVEQGEQYTEEDVIKLATAMIDHDLEVEEQMEKVAELDEAGRIMARAFLSELQPSN
jgi:hypothetical protein